MDKYHNIKRVIVFSFMIGISVNGYGQAKKWGDISTEELQKTVFTSDSSAAAVVLFDQAKVNFDHKLEFYMDRHIRIKIYSREGYEWATAEIPYNDERDQYVNKIKGQTFTLTEKGKVRKKRLDSNEIFEEDYSQNFKKIKFTLPSLEPGAIVEYRYRKKIGSPVWVPDWEFQRTIPVLWSEYKVKMPSWYFFNKMIVNSNKVHINETDPFFENMYVTLSRENSAHKSYYNARIEVDGHNYRWVMKDLPAVKKLPYMTSPNNYKAKLWMQLTEIRMPNQLHEVFLKSWDNIAEELLKSDLFGKRMRSNSGIRKIAAEATDGLETPLEKMMAVYGYMVESMVWDKNYSMLASDDLRDVLKARKGSSAELNLLMTQLLRDAGLQADPVVMSTRKNGRVVKYFAIANQFNHVISRVKIGDDSYLLDATSNDKAIDILPVNDLNGEGLLVSEDVSKWLKISPGNITKSRVVYNATLDKHGLLKGGVSFKAQGYHASLKHFEMDQKDEDDFLNEELMGGIKAVSVDSFTVKDKNYENSRFECEIYFSDMEPSVSQKSSNHLYFNPMLFLREESSPFKQSKRTIPVEFPYTFEKEFVANFTIPEGYVIKEVPKPKRITIPGNGIEIIRLSQVSGNRITILSKLKLKKSYYAPEEYEMLRGFYAKLVSLHNEPIVLSLGESSSES